MTTAVMQIVNSVYALRTFMQPKDGMFFKTLGREEPFDGKSAEYMYKEGDISVADNVDVIEHISGGGKFIAFKEENTNKIFNNFNELNIAQKRTGFYQVLEDETNDNEKSLYFYDGNILNWLPMVGV